MNWKPDTLVIGASGSKAFFQLGALRSIEYLLDDVKTYVGVSAGALFALLMVSGYSVEEIMGEFITSPLFRDLNGFLPEIEGKGKITYMIYEETIKEMMKKKFGYIPTLRRLYELTDIKLKIMVCNLTMNTESCLSYDSDPTMPCTTAVFLSFDFHGPLYATTYKDCTYIDGTFANPYPINIVDNGTSNVLGICVKNSTNQTHLVNKMHATIAFPVESLKQRSINSASDRCRNLILYSTFNDFNGLGSDRQARIAMITHGTKTADQFRESIGEDGCDYFILKPTDDLSKIDIVYEPDEHETSHETENIETFARAFAIAAVEAYTGSNHKHTDEDSDIFYNSNGQRIVVKDMKVVDL